MKSNKIFTSLVIVTFILASCGPVVVTSRLNNPPPSWFYPDRLEIVRYVYFPEYAIYFDLSMGNYLYQKNDVWVRVNVLPTQYRNVDLSRSRYVRVKDYRGNTIRDYHSKNVRSNTSRRSTSIINRRN